MTLQEIAKETFVVCFTKDTFASIMNHNSGLYHRRDDQDLGMAHEVKSPKSQPSQPQFS